MKILKLKIAIYISFSKRNGINTEDTIVVDKGREI